jgi:transposase
MRPVLSRETGTAFAGSGLYFRLMMIGLFEGIDSERGIAWRVADSRTLRQFLQIELDERRPDHVTISWTLRLIGAGAHQEVFGWVLKRLARGGLVQGKTIGIDSTTLEANAAMKSIVRRDTQESYTEYLKQLAEAEGVEAEDAAGLRRMDRKRAKKMSNQEWVNPNDPEAEIARLKDGRTPTKPNRHRYGDGSDCGGHHAWRATPSRLARPCLRRHRRWWSKLPKPRPGGSMR